MNPNKEMEEQYAAVSAAHAAAIAALVEGAPMSAAYAAATQVLKVGLCFFLLNIRYVVFKALVELCGVNERTRSFCC